LSAFYNLSLPPTNFVIPSTVSADRFLNDKRLPDPTDDY